jgi:hypothetical protein
MNDQSAITCASKFVEVTASNSTDLTAVSPKGLWIGTGGTLRITGAYDTEPVSLTNVPNGTYIPGCVKFVHTQSTCSGIVALGGA